MEEALLRDSFERVIERERERAWERRLERRCRGLGSSSISRLLEFLVGVEGKCYFVGVE